MVDDQTSSMDAEQLPVDSTSTDDEARLVETAEDPDAVRNAIHRHQELAKQAKRERDELAAKVAEYENRDKTEQEKLTERAAKAEKEAAQAQLERLRLEVALEKGLVGERSKLASRLTGTTKEELEADADQLIALIPTEPPQTTFDGGARGTPATAGGMDGMIRNAAGY